ncbi:hypothetical protein LY76DRAFT_592190 [Colletotrichum caudatum]|nr:hypothetical protein LY76DRAFT_592190 [Colletotrichum caudatum]
MRPGQVRLRPVTLTETNNLNADPPNPLHPVTGCSSGIGKALSTLIATKPGHRLIATARDPADLAHLPDADGNILKLPLGVAVNNAGYSLSGDTESATEGETHREMETLFFGTARVTTRAVGNMRRSAPGPPPRRRRLQTSRRSPGSAASPGTRTTTPGSGPSRAGPSPSPERCTPQWNINFCILEPSGVKTNFEGHSKARTAPHPAYAGADMPARVLDRYVEMGVKSGALTEPEAIAEAIYSIASRGERVPLRVPLGGPAWDFIRQKCELGLADLDEVKELSMGVQRTVGAG